MYQAEHDVGNFPVFCTCPFGEAEERQQWAYFGSLFPSSQVEGLDQAIPDVPPTG